MKVTGAATLLGPVERVYQVLNDPAVLVRTIPGCERLEQLGPDEYRMVVSAGVASIKGTYIGEVTLAEHDPPHGFTLRASGSGAPGTVKADVRITLDGSGETTTLTYDADAVVGGMVGGVGQRMLTSVSRRMAGEFFDNVGRAIADPSLVAAPSVADPSLVAPASPSTPSVGQVFTAPAKATNHDDFLKGVAVGAGLVVLGVVLGSVFGRRR